jgi:predicted RNA binding protein YcfA (HicA-like mRNA interferase family)
VTRREKTVARLRENPRDWRIQDLETLAAAHGIAVRKSGGSHVVFHHPAVPFALTVPARRKIKPVYVKKFIELLDALSAAGKES